MNTKEKLVYMQHLLILIKNYFYTVEHRESIYCYVNDELQNLIKNESFKKNTRYKHDNLLWNIRNITISPFRRIIIIIENGESATTRTLKINNLVEIKNE